MPLSNLPLSIPTYNYLISQINFLPPYSCGLNRLFPEFNNKREKKNTHKQTNKQKEKKGKKIFN